MVWAINLFALSLGLLIVGMIKPNWIMFWEEEPRRIPIIVFSALIFMVGATMFGQASLEKKNEMAGQAQQTSQTKEDTTPVVAPEAVAEAN